MIENLLAAAAAIAGRGEATAQAAALDFAACDMGTPDAAENDTNEYKEEGDFKHLKGNDKECHKESQKRSNDGHHGDP